MKHMKKLFSVCLALTVILASFAFAPVQASAWEAHTSNVDLRVGLMSDTHITATGSGVSEAKRALTALKTLGGTDMDGLLFVGDVIYYPSASSDPKDVTPYNNLYGAISEAGFAKTDVLAYAMGNHEFPQSNNDATVSAESISTFVAQTGFEMNHHTQKDGFHFIAGGAVNYNGTYSADTQKWLMDEIDKAIAADSTNDVDGAFGAGVIPDSTKPVFLLLHHPIDGTIFDVSGDKYTDEFVTFLKNRPQVINLTAHWHSPAQLPDNIWQDGFTAYQTPLTGGGYLEEVGAISTGNISGISQGSMMEIANNVVSLYKMDYVTGEYIGTPWVIDIPAIVADRLDADSSNDKAHMFYSKDKYEGANTPVFPEGSELKTQVEGDTVYVTYPNNAVMTATGNGVLQDDFVRGYKIVAELNGTETKSAIYMSDFYKAPANRAESVTRSLGNLNPGLQYDIKVYPMSPLKLLGEPLTAKIETEALNLAESTVRYEFEDHCTTHANIIRSSEYASGRKLLYSAYSTAWIPSGSLVNTNDSDGSNTEANDNVPLTYDFTVTVPYTCDYDINFAINDYAGDWVSKVYVLLDGEEIGNGDGTVTAALSRDGTYPYANTPLALFTKKNVSLTAGQEYTVTLKIDEPRANTTGSGNQPYLFCADYIEFVPKMPVLQAKSTTRMEVEDYASEFSKAGTVKSSVNVSEGKYVHWDTEYDANAANVVLEVPLYAEAEGPYKVEYLASAVGTSVKLYLDGTQINASATTVSTETKPAGAENYPYFNEYHHAANKYVFNTNIAAGEHTLKIELTNRGGANSDVAVCLDYFDFTYNGLSIGENASLKFGFYDYKENFSPATSTWNHASTYTGTLAYAGGGNTTTFRMPLAVTDAGLYNFEFVGAYSSGLSVIKFYLDSTDNTPFYTINASNTDYIDLSENKQVYQEKNGWLAKQYNFCANIPDGIHTIYVVAESRGTSGVAYAWDYLDIQYHQDIIRKEETTRLEFEDYVDLISIPETDGTDGKASIYNGAGASEGRYLGIDTSDKLAAVDTYSFSIPISIERGGLYAFEYVGNNGTSATEIYIEGMDEKLTTGINEEVLDDKVVDGKIQYFSSSWATAKRYYKKAILPEGKHKLVVQLKKRSDGDFARYLDYVQFTPSETFVIKAEGNSVGEFENYTSGPVSAQATGASGGLVATAGYTSYCPTIEIPVKVEKSGYYDVSYIVSNIGASVAENVNHKFLSVISLKIGDTTIGDNKGNAVEKLTHIYNAAWNTTSSDRFEKKAVYLEAGEQTLTATVFASEGDGYYKYLLDNIVFKPIDTFTVEDTTATAKVTFEKAVSGKVILAVYNDKEMVATGYVDASDTETISVTAKITGAYTHAKVFAWKDMTSLAPIVKPIELAVK